jgi:acetylornithine deacetylase/succinyl-diaminopimelate desuccinylase-like protein
VTELTMLTLSTGHKGFLWLEIEVLGHAAHGSDSENGVDAILNTGLLLNVLRDYSKVFPLDDYLGKALPHYGMIKGGEEPSPYPGSCHLQIELRTVPGQDVESTTREIESLLAKITGK